MMNTDRLIEWAKAHHIEERTANGFVTYLNNWKKDNRADFFDTFKGKSNVKLIQTEIHSIQLTHIANYNDFVYCTLNVLYLGETIGYYRMEFTLEGEVSDDSLSFDKLADHTIREGTVKVEIIMRAIKEGYSIEEIAKLIGLEENVIRPLFS